MMKHIFILKQNMKFFKPAVIFAILLVLSSCAGGAKAVESSGLGKGSDPVPLMANAKTGVLPSGLRYYLLENSMPEGRAMLTLAVDAGSVLETEDERGLAHFVEHMAFNGTERFPKNDLVNYLRSLGMRFGADINAYTSFDETVYGIEVPVETGPDGRKIIPDKALAIIDDWTGSISFYPDDVNSERAIIMEEYRSRLGAQERIMRQMFPVLFRGSPYAERLPIGLPEVIESATSARLKNFYNKWYRPENMAVIIVGDFDAGYLEKNLAQYFPARETAAGTVAAGKTVPFNRPRYNLPEPVKGSLQSLIVTDSELTQSRVDLYWKLKAEPARGDLSYYRQDLINNLVDTMINLRFHEAAAKPETPYVYAGSGMAKYGYSSRFYALIAQAKTGLVRDSLRELLLAKESLSRYGFTQDEIDAAGQALLSSMEQMVAEKDRQSSQEYVDAFTRLFLEGETLPDLEWELQAMQKLLPGISLKEINKTAADYFANNDLTVIISAPEAEKDTLPSQDEIKAAAAEISKAKIAPPLNGQAQGALMDHSPQPGAIVSETTDSETGAIRWKLGNGSEVILKATNNKNSEISLYAQARGGTLSAPADKAVSASLASEMVSASGIGSYSLPELTRILLDKQVSMGFWTQNFLRGFQGSASVKDMKSLFEMLYLSFTQPRIDPEAVKVMLDQQRTRLANQENDPNAVFRREITRVINGNPRFYPLELADLDKVKTDDALDFVRACLNPGDYTFVIVGNLDIPQIRTLVETYLASIPASQPLNDWADIDPQRPANPNTEKQVLKGKEERSAVYLSWFIPWQYSEDKSAAVSILNEYLDIKLNDEIRESLGGVYSISSWVSLSPIPRGELSGGVYFMCDPKRVEELISAVKAEFQKITQGDIDTDDFTKATKAALKGQEQSIQSNLYIAQSYANSAVIYHSPLSRLDKRPALFSAVGQADIQETMTNLMGGNLVRVVLYPEAN